MSFNDDRWIDFTFEVPKAIGFLDLPFSIKEKIIRFLKRKADKHEISLVHRKWSTAAQTVLFEKPRFDRPDQLRRFIHTIKNNSRLALLVKEIQLTYVDHEDDTVFKTIVKSDKRRHSIDTPLKDLNILMNIIQTCDKIEAVTIYGWDMQPYHIETLASFAKNLNSLYIIGANQNARGKPNMPHPIPLNSVLPNLTSLRLDGNFDLTEAWATTLVNKGLRLQHLQISLQNMHKDVLDILCSKNLKLKELVLTDSYVLRDDHLYHVLNRFPHLEKLCLEGSQFLTAVSVALAFNSCPGLVDLEIRSHPSGTHNNPGAVDKIGAYLQSADIARPTRLVLENVGINDEELIALSPALKYLNTLGFKNCKQLTNKSLMHLFYTHPNSKKFLRHLYLSNCPHLTSILFAEVSLVETLSRSIMDIHVESCGDITPRDIYKLCCASVNHNLRHLTFTDYRSLEKTVIGSFNEFTGSSQNENSTIILKKQSIDALAHSNDSELHPLPNNRMLTGTQITLLAKYLDMTTRALEDLFDKLEEEEIQQQKSLHVTIVPPIDLSKRKDRIGVLRTSGTQATEIRPNTPAIWNKEFQDGFLAIDNEEDTYGYTENSEEHTSNSEEQNGYDNDESYDSSYNDNESYNNNDDEDDRQDEDEYREYYNHDEIENDSRNDDDMNEEDYDEDLNNFDEDKADDDSDNTQNSHSQWVSESQFERSEEIDLGGWGVSNNDWSSPTKTTKTPSKPHQPSFLEIQQQQQQQQHHNHHEQQQQQQQQQQQHQQQHQHQQQPTSWTGYRAEDYQNNWVANPLEVNFSSSAKRQPVSTHSRNRPVVVENDGWGVPEKFVAWENLKDQGFAAEVLDKQKNTQYWQKKESGWVTLNNNNGPEKEPAIAAPERISTKSNVLSDRDFPTLQTANEKVVVSFNSLTEKARGEKQQSRSSRFSRARSSSIVSSDSDVNWDSGDQVQIKVNNVSLGNEKQVNGVKKASSKWANATDWNAKSDSKKDSWGNEIASTSAKPPKPEALTSQDDDPKGGAAKSWSSYLTNNISTNNTASHRRSYSRSRSSTPRPPAFTNVSKESTFRDSPTFDTDQWNDFSTANSHIPPSSPPRSSAASPFKKADQRTSTPSVDNLLDTDNLLVNTNILAPNATKSEVWDTMNELNSTLSPPKISTMTDILQPKDISKSKDAFKPDEVSQPIIESFDWSNDDMPSHISSTVITPTLYHFEETVSGTMTEKEKQRLSTAKSKDNLVLLNDSPIISATKPPNDLLHNDTELESALAELVSNSNSNNDSSSGDKGREIKTTSKDEEEDVFELGSSQHQTSDDEQKKVFSVSLRIQLDDGFQTLVLNQDDNVAEVVKKFCDDLGKPDYYTTILKSAEEKFQKRKTKYILKRSKKSKK